MYCTQEDGLEHQEPVHLPFHKEMRWVGSLCLAAGGPFYHILSPGHFCLTRLGSVLESINFQTLRLFKTINVFGFQYIVKKYFQA